jgi:hypothetical protein
MRRPIPRSLTSIHRDLYLGSRNYFLCNFLHLNNRRLLQIQIFIGCLILSFLAPIFRTGPLGTSSFLGEAEILVVEHGVISELFCYFSGLWEADIRRHCLGGGEVLLVLVLKMLSKWGRAVAKSG